MNSSTLRRLASDHASLRTSKLPPHYLFPPSSAACSMPDDLTQLTILLTGPQGTPYSKGLWKLHLKIPEDYPKSPPKAVFRTRMWHPNVEESTGSICVDTLKRDWDIKLTLRDVLITISCLLIQPNPDSALNANAGHLIQHDYEAFTRQARLMTSIHAQIPPNMSDAVLEAKRRGEDPDTEIREEPAERPILSHKSTSSSSVVMKKRPRMVDPPSRNVSGLSIVATPHEQHNENSDTEDEATASKENDPAHSPSRISSEQNPQRPALKRPLSDLPLPTEAEREESATPSDLNIAANTPHNASMIEPQRRSPKLVERSRSVNFSSRAPQDTSLSNTTDTRGESEDGPAPKRICSGEGKENASEGSTDKKEAAHPAVSAKPPMSTGAAAKVVMGMAKSGASATSVKAPKPRVGLRRL